jgi:hypothetical protein
MVQAIGLFLWLENGVVPEAQTVMVPFAPAWERSKVARMERSGMLEIRGPVLPDYASLHPGYAGFRWLPPGEGRVNLLGMCEGILFHVTYTERGDRIRIISARRAEKHEQDHYYRENSV